jgi:anti-sigma B factor antagonist
MTHTQSSARPTALPSRSGQAESPIRECKTGADLTTAIYTTGPARVIELAGAFDAYNAGELRQFLSRYPVTRHAHLIVDFQELRFIDSAGLGVFVALGKQVRRQDGTLRLVGQNGHVLDKLRRTGLAKVWPIHDDLESAISAIPPNKSLITGRAARIDAKPLRPVSLPGEPRTDEPRTVRYIWAVPEGTDHPEETEVVYPNESAAVDAAVIIAEMTAERPVPLTGAFLGMPDGGWQWIA